MKLGKEELIKKISDKVKDDDLQLEIIEDITDSFSESEASEDQDDYKTKYEDLRTKYKERFFSGSKDDSDELKVDAGDEIKKVIDIKEI